MVATKESRLRQLAFKGREATCAPGRKNDIINTYQTELKELIGASHFTTK
ncbi:hypothetical protein [uncultured Nonlabens sp.]|nr:hypothetical protein [uncultured Nonlabens sp.]